eukprot:TRINITY_DN5033_c0_g1_i1.p1 TRINITY_DN5033_c0_g1~~TRINITY_DN5033_c0_g1_i1.p1  ORF type:complete len:286 (-),score=75.87 TRINITY_DN5033_c0_g1_i1:2-859(-)
MKGVKYVPPNKKQEKKAEPELPRSLGIPFIDTHVHLDFVMEKKGIKNFTDMRKEFGDDYLGAINVCCFSSSFDMMERLMEEDSIFASFGMHPHEAKYFDQMEERIRKNMSHPKVVAWGECGLDFFKNQSPKEVQMNVFERQMKAAIEYKKPLIVHSRDADDETYQLMTKTLPKDYFIHLHCFGESSQEYANKMLEYFPNLFIGFTGAITFASNNKTRAIMKTIPLERILLETDGPFMAPVPFRGQTAHPGMIPLVAKTIANEKNIDVEQVLKQTTENAKRMYKCF